MADETKDPDVHHAVRLHTNGLVGSYAVAWPGGGRSGMTYEETVKVGRAMAAKMGLRFIGETTKGQRP